MTKARQELYGTGDLADRFGYSRSAIKLMDRTGVLPTAQRVAGRRVWDIKDLPLIEERLKARRHGRQAEQSEKAA